MNFITMFFLLVLGWLSGAAVNYFSDVLPFKRRLSPPLCVHCQAEISLSNYLFWPRRCFGCGRARLWRVWLVEAVYIALALWLWQAAPPRLGFGLGWLVLVYFGVVTVIDLEHKLILHPVSLFGAGLAALIGSYLHGPVAALAGGAAGFGFMLALYLLGALFLKVLGRLRGETIDDDALGFGDVTLSGVLGLLLGWPGIVAGLFLAVLLAGVIMGVYLLVQILRRRYRMLTALPYGPFLIASAFLLLFWRDWLLGVLGP
jgi:leader peptidase (prepilin peptidase) / N-methyltransferase